MATKQIKKLILQSSFEEKEKLQSFVGSLLQHIACCEEMHGYMMLSLSEAVNNAIVHGNDLQEEKKVTIIAVLENDILSISVADEGTGFDPKVIPDPLKEENLMNEGGRGIYLIRHYTDEVHFEDNGSKVIMDFELH